MPRRRVLALLALLAAPPAVGDDAPLPDLAGHVWPGDATPGEPVRLVGWVENAGRAEAGPFDVELRVNGTLLEARRVEGLAAGAYAWLESAETFTGKSEVHTFELRIDVLDEVAEAREDDNVATTVVLFTHERPDLDLVLRGARVRGWPRPVVEADYRVCNEGNRTAGGDVRVAGWLHGQGIPLLAPGPQAFPTASHGALAPGACAHGTLAVDAPYDLTGRRTVALHALIEGGDPVWERTLDNNRAARNVWMGPGPDPTTPPYL